MVDTVVINLTPNKVIPPQLRIAINGTEVFDGVIDRARSIRHEIELQDRLNITIHKTGKTKEVVDRKEPQEVLVEQVLLNGLDQHPDKFGVFDQKDNSYVKDQTIEGNEMALNGVWEFDIPVFRQPFVPHPDKDYRDEFTDTGTACFGCSFTYGSFLEYDQTWPYHLGGNTKNYGVGGSSISSVIGTAREYVKNFDCEKIAILLPHPCRLQLEDDTGKVHTLLPGRSPEIEKKFEEISRDIVMFGESSLLLAGYSNDLKNILKEISQKTKVYLSAYDKDVYDCLSLLNEGHYKMLPFYEMSSEFTLASDNAHPGPEHNRLFAESVAQYMDVMPTNLNTNKLTVKQKSYTIDEVVQATKDIEPDIWKK